MSALPDGAPFRYRCADVCLQQDLAEEIDSRTQHIFDGLSNAVYRAGKSQRRDAYNEAVDLVFSILDGLDQVLDDQAFLLGDDLTLADIWLFATFEKLDTVYATHFRCTRQRLIDDPNLWRFTRHIFQVRGIRQTVDFEEIRYGYYVNDGNYNPHGIFGQQPEIDWDELRAFEVTNLKVHDIEYDRMLIHGERGKGGKDREVMRSLFLLELRSDYWREARP